MKNALLLLFIFISGLGYSQSYMQQSNFLNANVNWIFGEKGGLNFSGDKPQPFSVDDFWVMDGASAVSHPVTGELLFYSDGLNCYDKNQKVMPNGAELLENPYAGIGRQGVAIVPFIGDTNKYYLFVLEGTTCGGDGWFGGYFCHELSYSVIDMSLNNGLGDVVTNQKHIVLESNLTSSVIAIPGDNCDIWVLVHSTSDPDTVSDPYFSAYNITHEGLNKTPITSTIQSGITTPPFISYPTFSKPQAYLGTYMAVSPNRKMLGLGIWNFDYGIGYPDGVMGPIFNDRMRVDLTSPNPGGDMEVHVAGVLGYQFDPATGIVSSEIFIRNYGGAGSVCFSPDNSKLYVNLMGPTNGGDFNSDTSSITQYDVSVWDSTRVVTSKTEVFKHRDQTTEYPIYLRLYNDTIYFGRYYKGNPIGRIDKPNEKGDACGYVDEAFNLTPGSGAIGLLGNDVVYPYQSEDTAKTEIDIIICEAFDTYTLDFDTSGLVTDIIWEDGSRDYSRVVEDRGVYSVSYWKDCQYNIETFKVGGDELDVKISVNEKTLSTTDTYEKYQWLLDDKIIEGATSATFDVKVNGWYKVVVERKGCIDTSEAYRVNNATSINDQNVLANAILIYPNPTTDVINIQSPIAVTVSLLSIEGREVLNTQEQRLSTQNLAPGVYTLKIMEANGNVLKVEKIIKQ